MMRPAAARRKRRAAINAKLVCSCRWYIAPRDHPGFQDPNAIPMIRDAWECPLHHDQPDTQARGGESRSASPGGVASSSQAVARLAAARC